MEVFELHFKKKTEEDLDLDSFCYEPENIYERRLGSLYLVGELKNALPQNEKLIHKIAQTIKAKFYGLPISSFDKSFEESLKAANNFLTEEVKEDNVSWLGNLNLAIIAVKNFDINFSKVGNIKILLLRKGQINDIGERLKFQEIEPYPLKIFSNIATGKLIQDDQLMILTEEAYQAFSIETQLVNEIAQIPVEDKSYARNLKRILKQKEKILTQISGICLLITITPDLLPKKEFLFEKEAPVFTISQIFKPFTDRIKSLLKNTKKITSKTTMDIKEKFSDIQAKGKKEARAIFKNPFSTLGAKISFLKNIRFPKLPNYSSLIANKELKKKIYLVVAFILVLALGFLIFKTGSQREIKADQARLIKIQEQVDSTKLLMQTDAKKANELLKESLSEVLDLESGVSSAIKNDAKKLEGDIEKNLYALNQLVEVENPQLLVEVDPKKFIPQKMVILEKELYLFSPLSENLFIINEKGEGSLITTEEKFNLATTSNNVILFEKPNKVIPMEQEPFSLTLPSPETDFIDLAFFKNSLYFLDSESDEILKYPYGNSEGNRYLTPETKKVTSAESLAIDGSVWVLDENNEIYHYYAGKYQNTLKFDTFPSVKNFQKISTSFLLDYLYILEPAENRIIIATKTGQIVKQFKSDKFDNLKDFAVSADGKTVYLLNGQKVYQVQF